MSHSQGTSLADPLRANLALVAVLAEALYDPIGERLRTVEVVVSGE